MSYMAMIVRMLSFRMTTRYLSLLYSSFKIPLINSDNTENSKQVSINNKYMDHTMVEQPWPQVRSVILVIEPRYSFKYTAFADKLFLT
jgi:hypothetical protein